MEVVQLPFWEGISATHSTKLVMLGMNRIRYLNEVLQCYHLLIKYAMILYFLIIGYDSIELSRRG